MMAIGRGDPFRRARTLYERRVSPTRTREMRGLLNESAAETAALLATTVLCDYLNRWNDAGPAEVARAEAAVEQALADDPELFLAHYAKGFICRARGQHQASLAAFDQAIRHAPDFARAHAQRGEQLLYLGRFDEAIASVEMAISISPKSSVLGYFYWVIGRAHFFKGHYAEAIPWLERSVRNWPNVWYNRAYLISAHALADKPASAKRVRQALDRRFPGYTLARVIDNERATPDDNRLVVAGRERFHEGLRRAGMPP